MSKKSAANNSNLVELVRLAMIRRLSYKEAVMVIEKQGYKISEKTCQRIKKKIEKSRIDAIKATNVDVQLGFTAEAAETLAVARAELVRILSDENTKTWEKIRACDAIGMN